MKKEIVNNKEPKQKKEREKNTSTKNNDTKMNFMKKPVFIIIIIVSILLLVIVPIIIYQIVIDAKIKKEKEIAANTYLKLTDDYKKFNNKVEDFGLKLKYDFIDNNNIKVVKNSFCDNDIKSEFSIKKCYVVELDNSDKIYILGNDEDKFDKIVYDGHNSDLKYTGLVLGTIIRLYSTSYTDENVNDFNNEFMSQENLDRNEGLYYVLSHLKFRYVNFESNDEYRYVIYASEYENQNQYKETDEYKNKYKEIYSSEVSKELEKYTESEQNVDSYDVNWETGLLDVKVKDTKSNLSKYSCANDTQELAKKILGSKKIGSLQFECINDSGTFYYVKVNNINAISTEDVDDNTQYFNVDFSQDYTNLENLKALVVSDYKNSCSSFDYKETLRNSGEYIGKRAYWFGKVLQVVDKSSYSSTYRIGVSCTQYHYIGGYSCPDTLYVTYFGDGNFIEDDMVNMWGMMNGTKSYTTVLGASLTVPNFTAQYIELQ